MTAVSEGSESLRDYLQTLERRGQLDRHPDAVDVRELGGLVGDSDRAFLFTTIRDYPTWRVAGNLLSTRDRLAIAMRCGGDEIAQRFDDAVVAPIEAITVDDAPCQEVVQEGEAVDLTSIPYPIMHRLDGGPYLSGTCVVCSSRGVRRNVGSYRLMYRSPTETGIDLVSPSDLRVLYERQLAQGEPLEIAVALGVHPFEMLAASYKAPPGTDEFAIAGGLRGKPTRLVKCKTVNTEVPADAECVLEGELLPIGWTEDEGPFGEFNHISGEVKWNPVFKVRCITQRRDPILWYLTMPLENDWLCAPAVEAAGLQALRAASVQPTAVRAPVGACGYWTLIASIKKRAGEGKNALLALLSVAEVKLAIVTDDDIDVNSPDELDWAMALRVQADKDVIVVPGARAKHIDPSVRARELAKGGLPVGAKLGIDATIPEGLSQEDYTRSEHYRMSTNPGAPDSVRGADGVWEQIGGRALHFTDVVDQFHGMSWPEFLRAWAAIRANGLVERDAEGRYVIAPSRNGTK